MTDIINNNKRRCLKNTKESQRLYEFGAHFKYEELYKRLESIKLIQESNDNIWNKNSIYIIN